jgi:hypothetical protein
MGGWGQRGGTLRTGRVGASPSSSPRVDSASIARGKGRVHRGDGMGAPPPIGPVPAVGQPLGQLPPGMGLSIKHR